MPRAFIHGALLIVLIVLLATPVACSTNDTTAQSPVNPALGSRTDPNNDLAEVERSPRKPGDITSVEFQSKPWMFDSTSGLHRGLKLTTPNYEIYTTKTTESFIDHLPLFYEAALANYTTALATLPYPKERLITFLFSDRRQWMAKTRDVLPDQAKAFRNLGRGGFTTRGTAVLYYIDYWRSRRHHDTLAIAAHEGWHQYTQSTFKNNLPVWLEEGIATYMEGFRNRRGMTIFSPADNYERRGALREAYYKARNKPKKYQLIPLDELVTKTPQEFLKIDKSILLTYYAQVWTLVRFLAEGEDGLYRPGLEKILVDAANGNIVKHVRNVGGKASWLKSDSSSKLGRLVISAYFTDDFEQFERNYLAFIEEIATADRGDR